MKILYVPGHLRAALEAAGASAAKDYAVENLVNILSPEDVAFYCYVNLDPKKVLPESIVRSFPNAQYAGKADPFAYNSEDGRIKEAMRILNGYCLNDSAPLPNYAELYLTCDLMDEDTIRFTHIPLETGAAIPVPEVAERALLDRLIQQLHGFMGIDEIAKLPLFAGYIKVSQTILGNPAHN